jgi:hypothetical protein
MVSILFPGCKKSNNDPKWEKTFGKGMAMYIGATSDSGLISCGQIEGYPYFNKLDENRSMTADYTYTDQGIYNSAWSNSIISIATGNAKGKMLISCFDDQCKLLWDTTFAASFAVNYTTVCYLGNGNLLAVSSGKMDSVFTAITGLYCVWFNTSGSIIRKNEIKESSYMLANKVVADNTGYIFVALTRKNAGSESKASVIKYNGDFKKIWETELYNNPNFGAASVDLVLDNSGNIFATGRTQLPASTGAVDNSYTLSLNSGGTIQWKEYLENTNAGVSIKLDGTGHVLMLNQKCFIIYSLNTNTGTTNALLRTYDVCESDKTSAYGWSVDINYDQYIIMAGSNNGNYYLCQKPPISYTQPI